MTRQMGDYIIAIDQSTSATKAMLFNDRCEMLQRVNVEHHQYYPKAGWVEHDAEEIYANVIAAVKQLMKDADMEASYSMAITNQRETVVVWDKTTGHPVCNAVVWQCMRGVDYTKTRISATGEESAAAADAAISDGATTTSAASTSPDVSADESTDSSTGSYTYRNSMEYHFPSVIITGRAAVVYSWRNKFAGATAIYNYSVAGDDAHLQLHRNKWRVRMFFGFRF